MAKRKARKQPINRETVFNKHKFTILLCLAVVIVTAGAILAKRGSTWFGNHPTGAAMQGSSLAPTSPAIEYIHAGGRMVASEQQGSGGATSNNASFVSQSVATTMTTGVTYNVTVTMQNTGTSTWIGGTHRLGSQNPANNMTWGFDRVDFSGSVAPSANAIFSFTITAPSTAGTYNFQWRMMEEGAGFFGATSTNVAVNVTSGGGGGSYNATCTAQSVPSSMNAGQSYSVSVTMKNTGTSSWNYPGDFSLSSQNPADNTTWGLSRVNLTATVTTTKTRTFSFTVTAPSTPGTYNFQWKMKKDSIGFFGSASPNVSVTVSSAGTPDNAVFVSQSVPTTMVAGLNYNVTVTMQNTGTTTWDTTTPYKLGSQNPQDNTIWGLNRVSLSSSVAPSAQVTFNFTVTAPANAGTYNFQWQMLHHTATYFGASSANLPITVNSTGGGTNNAAFVSQTVPTTMTAGQNYAVSIKLQNTGTTTWGVATYKLGSQNPAGNTTWGTNQVSLPSAVVPTTMVTINFTARAPSTPGTYNFQWQMLQAGVASFGALTTNVAVTVNSSGGLADNAQFISQNTPATMNAGQSYQVNILMKNTGTSTWTINHKLSSQNPAGTNRWGIITVPPSEVVEPNVTTTFRLKIRAPLTPGAYNFQWQMKRSSDGTYFGQLTTNIAVNVVSASSSLAVSTFSGNGTFGYSEGNGANAQWANPYAGVVGIDPISGVNAMFVADTENHLIRMVYLEGNLEGQSIIIAGSGIAGFWNGDGDSYQARFNHPRGIAAIKGSDGLITDLLIADTDNCVIRKLSAPAGGNSWIPTTFSGAGGPGYVDSNAAGCMYNAPKGVIANGSFIYVADSGNGAVRKLDLTGATTTHVGGVGSSTFAGVTGITASDFGGDMYVAVQSSHTIWKVTTSGTTQQVAGNGSNGSQNGSGTSSSFNQPFHIALADTPEGQILYVADQNNNTVRKIVINGYEVDTFAGTGTAGATNGPVLTATFDHLGGVAYGPGDALYVLDAMSNLIRRIE